MKSPKTFLLVGIGTICLIALFCIFFMGSLWFFFALLPDASGQVRRVGYLESVLSVVPSETQHIIRESIDVPEEDLKGFYKIAYQDDERGVSLIGIPKIGRQATMRSKLQRESWSVRRLGLLLIAYKPHGNTMQEAQQKGVLFALRDTFYKVALQQLPMRPNMLFQMIPVSAHEQSVALYVEDQLEGFHAVVSMQETGFLSGKNERINRKTIEKNTSFVSLQTDVLERISNRFNAIIQSEIAKSLGFKKTNPNIIGDLLSLGPLTIAKKGDAVAIGVFLMSDTPAEYMNQWISAEQSVRHPEKRAFTLPDKTVGYEYIPGETSARFALNKGNNSCLPSEGYDETVFLCGQDRAVVFTNEELLGKDLLSFLQAQQAGWNGVIQGELLAALGLGSAFHRIEYSGEDSLIEIWMDTKEDRAQIP